MLCINSLLIQMGNTYFGQQHSHSRDIPHHVRRCFVGISDPLLGSYFHGRILHRILFKSSWSPDTRYPTWSTCCSPAVPILTCTSQQRNSHNTSVVNLTFQTCLWERACQILQRECAVLISRSDRRCHCIEPFLSPPSLSIGAFHIPDAQE